MVSRRIEDIDAGELTIPASGDLLVILDKSDTTDDPDGTTKYIQYNNLIYKSGSRIFEIILPASAFVGDTAAQLVAGDAGATSVSHSGRPALAFDSTNEEAAVSYEFGWPNSYQTGTVKADLYFAMASDATNTVDMNVFVEAKTTNSDTLDMEAAVSWDTANSGTGNLAGTTAGDPLSLTIELTNKDSVAVNDLTRIGIRRDCDGNDTASGDLYLYSIKIYEEK